MDGNGHHCRGGLFLLCLEERAHHVTVWLWSESRMGVSRFLLAVIFKDEIKVHKSYKLIYKDSYSEHSIDQKEMCSPD